MRKYHADTQCQLAFILGQLLGRTSNLTSLRTLWLWNTSISDISALSNLTNLTYLWLEDSSISDISPLVANTGLGSGDTVVLIRNPLSATSINTHIPALQGRGVTVTFDSGGGGGGGSPDLVVDSPSVSNSALTTGQAFTLSATVRNSGTASSASTTLRYYRSSDATISASDTEVGTDSVNGLSAAGTSAESISLNASSNAGTYYYGACVESVSGESNTNNNCSDGVRVTVSSSGGGGSPDLVVDSPSVSSSALTTGQAFTLSATVRNSGTGSAASTTLRYYRSSDATISTSDTEVGTDSVNGLSAAGTSAESISLTAPSNADTYYYGACVESVTGESNTNNNCSDGVRVTVSSSATVTIADANLRAVIETALGKTNGATITQAEMATLTRLSASYEGIRSLTGLEHATNLRGLTLFTNSISDISALANLTNLTFLRLDQNSISDISALANLTNLTRLYLGSNSISDISALANLTNLTDLHLFTNSISNISALANLTKLTELQLQQNSISDISALSNLTNLTILSLNSNSISDISALSNLTNLTSLGLDVNSISDISALSNLTNLEILKLSNNSISSISALSNLTNLTDLRLGSNRSLSDISALSNLTNLTGLWLFNNSISDISPLVSNTGLGSGDTVELRHNPLSATSLNTHIPALQGRGVTVTFDRSPPDLTVDSPSVSDNTLTTGQSFTLRATVRNSGTASSASTTLRYYRSSDATISTSDTEVGTDSVGGLSAAGTSADSISLTAPSNAGTYYYGACVESVTGESNTNNNCSDGVRVTVSSSGGATVTIADANLRAVIADSLGKARGATITRTEMATLTELVAGNEGIRNLTGLEHATNLRWLELGYNSISDISALSNLTKLTYLDLSGNSISSFSALSNLTNLTALWLWSNSISDISALSNLTKLTTLELYNNSISNISVLSNLTNLRWLNLISNSISDISALSNLTNLTSLGLDGNSISNISVLSNLTKLTWLGLDGNSISDIAPLVSNTGLGSGDTVELRRNPLSATSINTHIPALQGRGVTVEFDSPDLTVDSPSVSDNTLTTGQSFTLRATVRNSGTASSASTTLRYYRSSDATISTSDTEVGTDSVGGLSAAGTSADSISLTAPSNAGTYYYGACVESVTGESNTGNNCSDGVRVTVSSSGGSGGACTAGLVVNPGGSCTYKGHTFSVSSSGRGSIAFFSAGTGIDARGSTINGVLWNFHATKNSNSNSWTIHTAE